MEYLFPKFFRSFTSQIDDLRRELHEKNAHIATLEILRSETEWDIGEHRRLLDEAEKRWLRSFYQIFISSSALQFLNLIYSIKRSQSSHFLRRSAFLMMLVYALVESGRVIRRCHRRVDSITRIFERQLFSCLEWSHLAEEDFSLSFKSCVLLSRLQLFFFVILGSNFLKKQPK